MNSSYSYAVGDNIYFPQKGGKLTQINSHHSHHDGSPNLVNQEDDTSVNKVLVGERYAYWGSQAIVIPEDIDIVNRGRDYRRNFPPGMERKFLDWFESLGAKGYLGDPVEFGRWMKKNI